MKNRSERNADVVTLRMLLKGVEIIQERPEGMTFEEFVLLRDSQKGLRKVLKLKHQPHRKYAGLVPQKLWYNVHPKYILPPNLDEKETPNTQETSNNDSNNDTTHTPE
jgi:hypothetical protein